MTVLARGPAGAVTANAETQDREALGALAAALACDGRPRAELPRHRAPRPQQGRGVLVISTGGFLFVQEASSLIFQEKGVDLLGSLSSAVMVVVPLGKSCRPWPVPRERGG